MGCFSICDDSINRIYIKPGESAQTLSNNRIIRLSIKFDLTLAKQPLNQITQTTELSPNESQHLFYNEQRRVDVAGWSRLSQELGDQLVRILGEDVADRCLHILYSLVCLELLQHFVERRQRISITHVSQCQDHDPAPGILIYLFRYKLLIQFHSSDCLTHLYRFLVVHLLQNTQTEVDVHHLVVQQIEDKLALCRLYYQLGVGLQQLGLVLGYMLDKRWDLALAQQHVRLVQQLLHHFGRTVFAQGLE